MLSKSSHEWESFPGRRALKHLQSRIASHHKYLESPSEIQPLEQELCSMTMGCQPPKGRNHSNCDPRLEKSKQNNNKVLLIARDLWIQRTPANSSISSTSFTLRSQVDTCLEWVRLYGKANVPQPSTGYPSCALKKSRYRVNDTLQPRYLALASVQAL